MKKYSLREIFVAIFITVFILAFGFLKFKSESDFVVFFLILSFLIYGILGFFCLIAYEKTRYKMFTLVGTWFCIISFLYFLISLFDFRLFGMSEYGDIDWIVLLLSGMISSLFGSLSSVLLVFKKNPLMRNFLLGFLSFLFVFCLGMLFLADDIDSGNIIILIIFSIFILLPLILMMFQTISNLFKTVKK